MDTPRPGTPEYQEYVAEQGQAAAAAALRMGLVRLFFAAMSCIFLLDALDDFLHDKPIFSTGVLIGVALGYVAIRGRSAFVSRILSGQPRP